MSARSRRGLALAAVTAGALAVWPAHAAPAPDAGLRRPELAPGGAVIWRSVPLPPAAAAAGASDSIALWSAAAARDSALRPFALLRVAELRLAGGDSLGADSALAASAERPSLWQARALDARAALWESRAAYASAESLLESAGRTAWTDSERAAWLLHLVRLFAALGDSLAAESFARQLVRAYPALPPATPALAELERRVLARRDSLGFDDERAAAEVEALAGRRAAAERRLVRALGLAEARARSATARRLSEVRRALRRWPAAREAVALALASAPDSAARADAWLERARSFRDQGLLDSTLAAYEVAIAAAPDSNRREAWRWERAREDEDAGRWDAAGAQFAEIARMARRRAGDGVFRAGLMHYAAGRSDSALAWWSRDSSEAVRFWRAVALRSRGARPAADSLLRALAERPGYSYYRMAARETLGVRGWPGRDVAAAESAREPAVDLARTLIALGQPGEAVTVLSRWNAGDLRAPGPRTPRAPATWLAASAAASAAGHAPLAIVLAERASAALEDSGAARAWSAVPWLYPPAFDSLVRARPDGLEPALLWAVMRQESRFDPRARSPSAALGLMQLKLDTAGDMAKLLRVRVPAREEDLFEPAANLRYGARYLRRLLDRFDQRLAVALSAYNAGPSTIPPFWRELVARGGEALFVEIASNADAQNYARKITSNLAAYRELRPAPAP